MARSYAQPRVGDVKALACEAVKGPHGKCIAIKLFTKAFTPPTHKGHGPEQILCHQRVLLPLIMLKLKIKFA